jgi:hypothetical protein
MLSVSLSTNSITAPGRVVQTAEEKPTRQKLTIIKRQLTILQKKNTNTTKALLHSREEIYTLHTILDASKSRQESACIKSRNGKSSVELRRDYESISASKGGYLQVFCVSSNAHYTLRCGTETFCGFPRSKDTGIDDLRKWLSKTTLRTRNEHAEAVLVGFDSFRPSMKQWLADTSLHSGLDNFQRQTVDNTFTTALKIMKKACFPHYSLTLLSVHN